MPATWMPHLGGVSLLKRVDRIRLFRGRPKEGLDAFDRDWGCCRGRALARGRGADAVGAGECRGDRAGGGRHRPPDAGPLLVRVARSARQLPALALLVRRRSASSTRAREEDAPPGQRPGGCVFERAGEARACDQCSVPIMQSLKRCACRRPAPPRPSPSPTSLPTISRHFCSSSAPLSLALVRCAACDGAANATRESSSTIILTLMSISELVADTCEFVFATLGPTLRARALSAKFCDAKSS